MKFPAKLILVDVDHELMIMKEGVGWPITDTYRQ
jgi:hypothetical protein